MDTLFCRGGVRPRVPTLDVELNGDGVHAVDAPDRFVSDGPFVVALENAGRSTHVHLRFDDELDRITGLDEVNHFVTDEGTRRVHVPTAAVDAPVRGTLGIVTGYGSNTEYVDVRIDPSSDADGDGVRVDEALATPPERTPEPSPERRATNAVDGLVRRGGAVGAALGVVAVVTGAVVAVTVNSAAVAAVVAVALMIALGAALLAMG